MKQKQPSKCKGCPYWHDAGHKPGSRLFGSKYNNWCCNYGTHAPKAAGGCSRKD